MVQGVAPGASRHHDLVAHLERLAVHALVAELRSAAPLDSEALHFALLVLRLHVDPRVRAADDDLDEFALDLLFGVGLVDRHLRVMRVQAHAEHQHHRCCATRENPIHDHVLRCPR